MISREFKKEDYEQVSSWFVAWNWAPVPFMFLSKRGFIISNEGVDICAGWIYGTDSAVCWAENFISNNKAPRELRRGAVEFLIGVMTEQAKALGYVVMMSSIKRGPLVDKLIKCGYNENVEDNMCNLMRLL